ncbi:MAG: orotidine-5'-phosphate decarboxylase [Fidelibacterota bacterium]
MNSFNSRLSHHIADKHSWLCVGLDINPENLHGKDSTLTELKSHTKSVIDATRDFAAAYKPNLAFFERWGSKGFAWLEETMEYIGRQTLIIGDAKRGDIGHTATQYAISLFDHFGFDAVTLNPYMGRDTIEPFIQNPEKGVFVLCRTSNQSGNDLQNLNTNGKRLFESVAEYCANLNENNNIGLVVGATNPEEIQLVRSKAPGLPLLIPGIGAQGGALEASLTAGNTNGAALINVSRGISFAGDQGEEAIHDAAKDYVEKMRKIAKNLDLCYMNDDF